jgi:predicted PurR-regulated permease PerM
MTTAREPLVEAHRIPHLPAEQTVQPGADGSAFRSLSWLASTGGRPFFTRGVAFGGGLLVCVGTGYLAFAARDGLFLIALAALLAIGLNPAVGWLSKHGLRHGAAVAAVTASLVLTTCGMLGVLIPAIFRQASAVLDALPAWVEGLRHSSLLARIGDRLPLNRVLTGSATEAWASALSSHLADVGGSVATALTQAAVVIALTAYFLAELPRISAAAPADQSKVEGRSIHHRTARIAEMLVIRLGGYLSGTAFVAFLAALVAWTMASVLGLPSPLAVGLVAGLLDFLPLIGPLITAIMVTILGLTVSTTVGAVAVSFYLCHHLFEAYWLHPRVMRRQVRIPALVVIVAVVLGGAALGVRGALLAVPLVATMSVLITEVRAGSRTPSPIRRHLLETP